AVGLNARALAASRNGAGSLNQPTSQEADEAAVRSLVPRASDAWGRGDAESLAAAWAEDGELVTGDGSYHSGRPEIERYLRRLLTGPWKGSRFVATVTSIRFPRPDVAHFRSASITRGSIGSANTVRR